MTASSGLVGNRYAVEAPSQVWLSILVTGFGFGAMFGAFTYIPPMLTQVVGFPETAVPWTLVLFGVGLFAGNIFGGRPVDKK